MVTCKYFLQGRCVFGSSCWYGHNVPASNAPEASQSSSAEVPDGLNVDGSYVQNAQAAHIAAPCRHFAAGHCKNGAACRFKYGDAQDANNISRENVVIPLLVKL